MVVELAASVGRDALMRQLFQQVDDGSGDAIGRLALRLAAQEQAALSVDHGRTTGFSYCAAHGVGFPIAQSRRSLIYDVQDSALSRDPFSAWLIDL